MTLALMLALAAAHTGAGYGADTAPLLTSFSSTYPADGDVDIPVDVAPFVKLKGHCNPCTLSISPTEGGPDIPVVQTPLGADRIELAPASLEPNTSYTIELHGLVDGFTEFSFTTGTQTTPPPPAHTVGITVTSQQCFNRAEESLGFDQYYALSAVPTVDGGAARGQMLEWQGALGGGISEASGQRDRVLGALNTDFGPQDCASTRLRAIDGAWSPSVESCVNLQPLPGSECEDRPAPERTCGCVATPRWTGLYSMLLGPMLLLAARRRV